MSFYSWPIYRDVVTLIPKNTKSYLYRAVDKEGQTIAFLLTAHRDKKVALRFFKKAGRQHGLPGKVTLNLANNFPSRDQSHPKVAEAITYTHQPSNFPYTSSDFNLLSCKVH